MGFESSVATKAIENIHHIYLFWGWCGGEQEEAEGIHWLSSRSDGSEKSQSLLCKELKPPLQIAPIFV